MARTASLGQSLILTSALALLSYIPFECIAKFTLAFCALLFIFDPIPPTSRILALAGVLSVALLSKIERQWRLGQINIDIDTDIDIQNNIQHDGDDVHDSDKPTKKSD
jgi:hypothetical protein